MKPKGEIPQMKNVNIQMNPAQRLAVKEFTNMANITFRPIAKYVNNDIFNTLDQLTVARLDKMADVAMKKFGEKQINNNALNTAINKLMHYRKTTKDIISKEITYEFSLSIAEFTILTDFIRTIQESCIVISSILEGPKKNLVEAFEELKKSNKIALKAFGVEVKTKIDFDVDGGEWVQIYVKATNCVKKFDLIKDLLLKSNNDVTDLTAL